MTVESTQASREKIRLRTNKYRADHREWSRKYMREYSRKYSPIYHQKNLESWIGIIPKETTCQICGKKIIFCHSKKQLELIHFDHKNENCPIKTDPRKWLKKSPRSIQKERLWAESGFGMLCKRCNAILPTKNRSDYILKVIKYVFGIDLITA